MRLRKLVAKSQAILNDDLKALWFLFVTNRLCHLQDCKSSVLTLIPIMFNGKHLFLVDAVHSKVISSFPGLNSEDWGVILSENYKFWYPQCIILSPNLFVQLTDALDLYDGLSENGANPIVNNTSSVKFIDLETWYYKTQYDNWSQESDTLILCTFVGNFQQYPQMLIITASNQLQGITLQGIGGKGFSNKSADTVRRHVQKLVVGNSNIMMYISMAEGDLTIVPPISPIISKFKTYGSDASSNVNLMIASQIQCIYGVIQAFVGVGYALVATNYKRLF
ncbi:MAG: hypothetical protein EZS28_034517 [Streblomastix strix]|uniref:Uncharacterized protein n=1 Tax=Streblomastix strix TaxID=222440 RepID=A0A5J4UJW3_9EUKA|nr:MAG: hypothetical protein EZS28_034517 [Streblomastix strix]